MKCPRCEHENEIGAKFCEECAAPFARACDNCGHSLSPRAKFCPECAHPTGSGLTAALILRSPPPGSYTPRHLAEKILTSKAALEGERKHVTVLFADLKGSMELLADRDPQKARKILDPVLERMMEAVHRYEGTVNQVMGDGIMALFGAPIAHEDHAVRACYAALRMQDSICRYSESVRRTEGVPIRIRVGVNSGEVVVRSIGSDLHMDYTAVGQTTHLAARMEQIAAPETIAIAPATLALAEGFVQVRPLGPIAAELTRHARQRGNHASALWVLGEVAAHPAKLQPETADARYREALSLATALEMRPLVAHCHFGLGTLYWRTGTRQEAQEHIATATAMYREMGMTYWSAKAEITITEPYGRVPSEGA